jgi:hypothetical protein
LRIANCELRIANCELRIANCELRIANCELRIANCAEHFTPALYHLQLPYLQPAIHVSRTMHRLICNPQFTIRILASPSIQPRVDCLVLAVEVAEFVVKFVVDWAVSRVGLVDLADLDLAGEALE